MRCSFLHVHLRRAGALALLLAAGCTRDLSAPLPVSNKGYLSGRLVEASPGTDLTQPIAQGTIAIPNTNLSAVSDANGSFVIGPLPEGKYRLQFTGASVTGSQRRRLLSSVSVTRGATSSLGDVSLKENAELAGRVLIGTQLLGNTGITVFVPGTDFVTTTADSGAWLLRQLPEGTLRAAAFRPGFRPATTTDLQLQGGTVTSAIDLVITPEPPLKARISGTVLVLDAASSAGVVVKAVSLTAQTTVATRTTTADGAFALEALDPDLYTITAEATDRPVGRVPNLAVGAGVDARLAEPIVLAIGGSPAASAQCTAAAQCDGGRVCQNGSCSDCAGSAQCGAGFSCRGGRCAHDCSSNADCPGQVCGASRCRPCAATAECAAPALVCNGAGQCSHCNDRLDCPAGQACLASGCAACLLDADCGAGATCASGSCVPGSCSSNDGCPLARACVSHQCGSCSGDSDCRFGQLCLAGVCLAGNCRTAAQCANGQVCAANQCGACKSDTECGAGLLCLATLQGGRCSPGDCRDTSNCTGAKSGQVCFGNTCTDCGGPVSCAAGLACASGRCGTAVLRTVLVATSGSGTVTSSPGTISCAGGAGTCAAVFSLGDTVTLSAAPSAGFFFGGWAGAAGCGASPSCTFVVTGDASVTATFNAGATLAVATAGLGTVTSSPAAISCPGTCSASLAVGAAVTLSASPVFGYALAGWSGGGCTGTGPCAVTLSQATTVTATFVKQPVLTVAVGGPGAGTVTSSPAGINCPTSGGGTCSAPFPSGTSITLTAAATAQPFGGWLSGGCSGTATTCTLTLSADNTVSAGFGTVFTLGLTVTGPGSVSADSGAISGCGQGGTCTGKYPANAVVLLTASAQASAALSSWGGDCAAASGNTCTLALSQARAATASFAQVTTLSVVQGDKQGAPSDALLPSSVILKVAGTATGAPITGAAVTLAGPPGSVVTPATATTGATGQAIFGVRLARTLGTQSFTASTATAALPLTVTATASTPSSGLVSTLVNIDHVTGATGIPGPGTVARINGPTGLALAQDGTLYLASANNQVFSLSPAGALAAVVGTGTCGHAGDLGFATAAQICNPLDLVLDETNARKTLYILDGAVVRAVNLNANPPTIATFAGGGSAPSPGYGDGSPATSAALNAPNHLALGPAGDFLYIVDSGIARFRRVDLNSGIISAWLSAPANTTCQKTACGVFIYNDCTVGFDNAQLPYVTYAAGSSSTQCQGGSPGGVYRVAANGSTTLVAGGGTAAGEGVPAIGAALAPSISKVLFDAAGNLYVVEQAGNRIRRVEAGVGRVTTIAGTGAAGYAGDYADARQAQFNGVWTALFGANQDLILSDTANSAVRTLWSAGLATSAFATLSVTSPNPQSVVIDQVTAPLSVTLLDPAGQPLPGYTVNWSILDPGSALYVNSSVTNISGIATSLARAGLLPLVPYRFSASVNVFGGPLPTSPATLTVNATAPAAGSMFTIANVDHTAGGDGYPGAATLAHLNNPTGLAAASDGTLYLAGSTNNQVFALSPSGFLSVVAGTGTCGHTGDNGLATAAQLCAPLDLALDQSQLRKTLYIVDGVLIRAVDLKASPPTITTVAGGGSVAGPGYGDNQPAIFATLNNPTHIAVGPAGDFLYLADTGSSSRFRKVDLSGPSGLITAWVSPAPNTACSSTNCGTFVSNDCAIGFDNSQNPYVSYAAGSLGTQCQGGSPGGVYRVAANGSTTLIAGNGTTTGEGIPALGAALAPNLSKLLFDPSGALYLVERLSHRVRKLSDLTTSATIRTVIGTGTAGNGADGPNPLSIAISSPWSAAVLPDGKLVLSDSGNSTVRALWPPLP